MGERIIGIMGAMPEETNGIIGLLTEKEECILGKRTYYSGKINNIKTVVVFSRWGKVAASATASTLILKFNVSEIIFTGVAGALNHDLNIGDIVIAKRLVQHDMDGRPLMAQFELPLLNITYIPSSTTLCETAVIAVNKLIAENNVKKLISSDDLKKFHINKPKLLMGDIASGDKFFSKKEEKDRLLMKLPDTLCVEMEGAAVAQVCYEYNISFVIIRTISDTADEQSPIDFPAFIEKISNIYSVEIIKNIFAK